MSRKIVTYEEIVEDVVERCDICGEYIVHDYYYEDTKHCSLCGADLCSECAGRSMSEFDSSAIACPKCREEYKDMFDEMKMINEKFWDDRKNLRKKLYSVAIRKYKLKQDGGYYG